MAMDNTQTTTTSIITSISKMNEGISQSNYNLNNFIDFLNYDLPTSMNYLGYDDDNANMMQSGEQYMLNNTFYDIQLQTPSFNEKFNFELKSQFNNQQEQNVAIAQLCCNNASNEDESDDSDKDCLMFDIDENFMKLTEFIDEPECLQDKSQEQHEEKPAQQITHIDYCNLNDEQVKELLFKIDDARKYWSQMLITTQNDDTSQLTDVELDAIIDYLIEKSNN